MMMLVLQKLEYCITNTKKIIECGDIPPSRKVDKPQIKLWYQESLLLTKCKQEKRINNFSFLL